MPTKLKDIIYSVAEMPPIARLIPLGYQFTVYTAVSLVCTLLVDRACDTAGGREQNPRNHYWISSPLH